MKNLAKMFFVVLVVAGVGSARADDASKLQLAEQVYNVEHSEYALIVGMMTGIRQVNTAMFTGAIEQEKKQGRSSADFEYLQKCQSTKAYNKYLENTARSVFPADKTKTETVKIYEEEFSKDQLAEIAKKFPSAVYLKILQRQTLTSEEQTKVEDYKNSDIGKIEVTKLPEISEKIQSRVLPIIQDSQKENEEAMKAGKPPRNAKEMQEQMMILNQECAKELGIAPIIIKQPVTSN